jgi:predicted PurR-regulated permease PerM
VNAFRSKLEENLGWFILIVLAVACLLVVWPFVSVFLWAAILCFSCWPLYQRLTVFLNNRRTLAAALMTLGLTLIILLPFALVGLRSLTRSKT